MRKYAVTNRDDSDFSTNASVDISRSGVKKKQYLEKTQKRRVVQFCLG